MSDFPEPYIDEVKRSAFESELLSISKQLDDTRKRLFQQSQLNIKLLRMSGQLKDALNEPDFYKYALN